MKPNLSSLSSKFIPGFIFLLGFLTIDFLWIKALPILNISFGTTFQTFFMFFYFRITSFAFWSFLVLSIPKWRNSPRPRILILFLALPNLFLLIFGLYGFYVEPINLTESTIEIPVYGLEKKIRIVQLSDLHVERTTKREQELPSIVASLNPDMIVITGDFLIESRLSLDESIEALRKLIDQLDAPMGIYAVNGNVETPLRLQKLLINNNVKVLDDQIIRLPEISNQFVIIGLSFHDWAFDAERLSKLMMGQVNTNDYTLLLYHKPDLAYVADEVGVNLYLAGHTHGGQLRMPFYGAIYTNSRYGKTFEMGLYHLKNTTMYVNRGLGFTGGSAPRIRFLAPPEVTIVDLVPK